MEGFDHILNWKLKKGSHWFPGPDGGTCINEAALVAAGFAYRPIYGVWQMPRCFSRPICRFAMCLNDSASDEERQLLLSYVTRLACADTPEIERQRAAYIRARVPAARMMMIRLMSIEKGIAVLEGALAIGRQADPLALDAAEARLEAMKGEAEARSKAKALKASTKPNRPLFGKVQAWLSTKVLEPAD